MEGLKPSMSLSFHTNNLAAYILQSANRFFIISKFFPELLIKERKEQ